MKAQLGEKVEPRKVRRARKRIRTLLYKIKLNFVKVELIDKKSKQGLRFRKVKGGNWMIEKLGDTPIPTVNTNSIEITELVDLEKELKRPKDVLGFQQFLKRAKIE